MSTIGADGSQVDTQSDTHPFDRDDPRVQAARSAEKRAYELYDLEYREHFVPVPKIGSQIRVVEVGSGPPVVLVPGGIGHGIHFLPLLAELEGYTLYVMDRPGGGLSGGVDYQIYSLQKLAVESTAALFEYFELEDAPIVGNSMGGFWALQFELEHPRRVSEIALLGCPGLYPTMNAPLPFRLASLPWLGDTLIETMLQPAAPGDILDTLEFMGHPDETVNQIPEELAGAFYRMDALPGYTRSWSGLIQRVFRLRGKRSDPAFTADEFRNVSSPVTLLWGADDLFGSLEDGRTGASYFDDAEFHQVGTGHLPWFDQPERVGELIRTFFTRNV